MPLNGARIAEACLLSRSWGPLSLCVSLHMACPHVLTAMILSHYRLRLVTHRGLRVHSCPSFMEPTVLYILLHSAVVRIPTRDLRAFIGGLIFWFCKEENQPCSGFRHSQWIGGQYGNITPRPSPVRPQYNRPSVLINGFHTATY